MPFVFRRANAQGAKVKMVEHSPAGRRALIVEDETLFAMGLAVDMQALGFAPCDLAANGQDAFLKAMEDQPDIVLMDVNLEGGREGIEAARWLREVCEIPIVFITAYTDHDTVARIHKQVPGAPVIAKSVYRSRRSGGVRTDVRFGSLADITTSSLHVRFTPNNGRWSAH